MIPSTVVGSVMGTGAAINVIIGFKPDYVECENNTTASRLHRYRGTNGVKTVAAGTITVVSGTASLQDYSAAAGDGFTIPADANTNVNGQLINYVAHRSGPGST